MSRLNILMMASSRGVGLVHSTVTPLIALKRRGLNVVAMSSEKEHQVGLKARIKEHGIKLYECNYIDDISPWSIWKGIRGIKRIIVSENIDVIHAQGILHLIKAYLAHRLLFQKRRVAIVQSVNSYYRGLFQKSFLTAEVKLMNLCADLIMPVSKLLEQKLIKSGLSLSKCITVQNGVDFEEIEQAMSGFLHSTEVSNLIHNLSGCPKVIYPARLITLKGHCYYLEAAAQALKEFPETRFIIAGDGPLRAKLERMASNLGIAENVIFTGWIKFDSLPLLLSRADIGAFPSLTEAFSIGVLDLIAAGKPVVATSVGGIPEMIKDRKNGFLVPPADSAALAQGIITLLKNPQKAKEMGIRGQKICKEKFDANIIAERLEAAYMFALKQVQERKN